MAQLVGNPDLGRLFSPSWSYRDKFLRILDDSDPQSTELLYERTSRYLTIDPDDPQGSLRQIITTSELRLSGPFSIASDGTITGIIQDAAYTVDNIEQFSRSGLSLDAQSLISLIDAARADRNDDGEEEVHALLFGDVTQIVGASGDIEYENHFNASAVTMGADDNWVRVRSLDKDLQIDGGPGTNRLLLHEVFNQSIALDAGRASIGPHVVSFRNFEDLNLSGDGLHVIGNDGPNRVDVSNLFGRRPSGEIQPNVIEGRGGDDRISVSVSNLTVFAGAGNDTVTSRGSEDLIYGGHGDDSIDSSGGADEIFAGPGHDVVSSGFGPDRVFLNQGDDRFDDNPEGGPNGRDTVWAGYGDDSIFGGNGDDVFYGEWGNDSIEGKKGNDLIFGGDQFDSIAAGEGDDTVFGGNGRDEVFLNQGDDLYADNGQGGVLGRDTVYGGYGDDTIDGGNGDDHFLGEWGNDWILARVGADMLDGGEGADTLNGGAGQDTLIGGADADIFAFDRRDLASGPDLVTDFIDNEDVIRLIGFERVTFDYTAATNEIALLTNGTLIATLRSGLDLSGFGMDDIAFA